MLVSPHRLSKSWRYLLRTHKEKFSLLPVVATATLISPGSSQGCLYWHGSAHRRQQRHGSLESVCPLLNCIDCEGEYAGVKAHRAHPLLASLRYGCQRADAREGLAQRAASAEKLGVPHPLWKTNS